MRVARQVSLTWRLPHSLRRNDMTTLRMPAFDGGRHRLSASLAIAAIVEGALLAGGYLLFSHPAPAPVPTAPPPMALSLVSPPPVVAPKVPTPAPKPVPQSLPKPPVVPPRVVHRAAPVHPLSRPIASPPSLPPSMTPSAPATATPDAAAKPSVTQRTDAADSAKSHAAAPVMSGAEKATFEGAVRAAIQSALRYPESARMAGMTGQTRVGFDYRDGQVSNVTMLTSSGMDMLDRAALAAVHDAHYPPPPATQAGKTLHQQLWVTFNLDENE